MKSLIMFISGLVLGVIITMLIITNEDYCTNNNTRDKFYESYVESTRIFDEAAFDSIKTTQQYQKYIAEHGEWFNNYNY